MAFSGTFLNLGIVKINKYLVCLTNYFNYINYETGDKFHKKKSFLFVINMK